MIEAYWRDAILVPFLCGLAVVALLALPNALWELGQWRIGYLGRRLPAHCYARIAAPPALAAALHSALAYTFARIATHAQWRPGYGLPALILFSAVAAVVVYVLSRMVMWRVLRMPFALPGEGTQPQLHWSARADRG